MTDSTTIRQAPSYDGPPGRLTRAARAVVPRPLRRWVRAGYAAVLEAVTAGRGVTRTAPGGETVRVAPTHRHLAWNVAEYHAFRTATPAGGTVLDVGANLGAYSLLFGRWVGPAGRVFAFEPSPDTQAALARHVRLNGLVGVVELVTTAVSDRTGEAAFRTDAPAGLHRLVGGSTPDESVSVPVITLDDFCRDRNLQPTVVKIDVEGFELSVLRGARETLARVGDGLTAFMEIHPTLWPEAGVTQEAVEAELAAQGLAAEPLVAGEPVWTVEGVCLRLQRAVA